MAIFRAFRRCRPRARNTLRARHANRRRGRPVGRDRRRVYRGTASCRRDTEARLASSPSWWRRRSRMPRVAPARPAGRGAGRVASGRDAGGAWSVAGRGVRGGHRGGRAAAGRRGEHVPLRARWDVHLRRRVGRARALPVGAAGPWEDNLGRSCSRRAVPPGSRPLTKPPRRARRVRRRASDRVAVPIVVEGRLWGAIAGSSRSGRCQRTPRRGSAVHRAGGDGDRERREPRRLTASRARIVAAADDARRRIERDLHDGIQQQLVSLMLDLRAVQAQVPPGLAELQGGLSRIAERVSGVFDQAREISHGIHPAILSARGLTPALRALARRSAVPVELDLRSRAAAARAGRGRGVLRGVGGAGQRRQARARFRRARRTRRTRRGRAAGDPRRRDRRRRPRPRRLD